MVKPLCHTFLVNVQCVERRKIDSFAQASQHLLHHSSITFFSAWTARIYAHPANAMSHKQVPDPTAPVYQLEIKGVFEGLSQREKLYAHHMSRACWYGTRISLRQTSPEAVAIFEFILALYKVCKGRWDELAAMCGIPHAEVEAFMSYAAMFLCNLGNFYVSARFE